MIQLIGIIVGVYAAIRLMEIWLKGYGSKGTAGAFFIALSVVGFLAVILCLAGVIFGSSPSV